MCKYGKHLIQKHINGKKKIILWGIFIGPNFYLNFLNNTNKSPKIQQKSEKVSYCRCKPLSTVSWHQGPSSNSSADTNFMYVSLYFIIQNTSLMSYIRDVLGHLQSYFTLIFILESVGPIPVLFLLFSVILL